MIESPTQERVIRCFTQGHGMHESEVTCPVPDPILIVKDSEMEQFKDRKTFGMFRVLTRLDGDKRVVWNKFSLPEIESARQMFTDLIKKGLAAFKVDSKGKQTTEIMQDFDPQAEEIIFVPVKALCPG
jgi:hypothetical protein